MKQFRFKTLMSLFAAVAMLFATSLTAQAQTPVVSIDVKNVSVKELFKTIESESGYTFAYVDSEIDLSKNVSVNATNKSIASIIAEVLPNMQVEFKDKKVILTAKPVSTPKTTVASATRTVTGKVVDPNGDPVVGAMVILQGTTIGSATDLDGKYSITIQKNNAVLEVSSIGYQTTRAQLNDHQVQADFVLPTEITKLDDVVVIGYGVQNKRDVTTAITSIKAEEFKSLPTADFRDAMAAKMPGVQVLALGGQPDGNVSIRVRGIQSATSGNDPLYVIDGVPCDARAFANIDGSDIESLEVLKDASAAAIYGSRGSCGVILITTKRGSSEKPVISYDGQFSLSQVAKKIDMLNAYEWAEMYVEARNGAYLKEQPTGSINDPASARNSTYARIKPQILEYLYDETGTLTDTDWQDAIFRTAQTHKHSVSVSARTKNYNYYVGNYYLCEQVKIDENRLDINDPYDVEDAYSGNPADYGYLLESDDAYDETWMFTTACYVPFLFKDDGNDAMLTYASEFVRGIEDNLYKNTTAGYTEAFAKMDLASFVDFWLIQELMMNSETQHPKSCYSYINNGIMYAGPIWDFDWNTLPVSSSYSEEGYSYTTSMISKASPYHKRSGYPDKPNNESDANYLWYPMLVKSTQFKDLAAERWNAVSGAVQAYVSIEIPKVKAAIATSEAENNKMWPVDSKSGWIGPRYNSYGIGGGYCGDEGKSFNEAVSTMQTTLNSRISGMNSFVSGKNWPSKSYSNR